MAPPAAIARPIVAAAIMATVLSAEVWPEISLASSFNWESSSMMLEDSSLSVVVLLSLSWTNIGVSSDVVVAFSSEAYKIGSSSVEGVMSSGGVCVRMSSDAAKAIEIKGAHNKAISRVQTNSFVEYALQFLIFSLTRSLTKCYVLFRTMPWNKLF